MRCLIKRCPNGFTVCCQACECADFCKDKCSIKKPCQAQISTNPIDLEIKPKKKDKPFNLIISILILCMSVLLLGAAGNVLLMQTDTLNAINDTRLEIDDLKAESVLLEQVDLNEEKTVTTDEKAPLTTSERELIERVCMAEAGSDIEGLMAVAQVIHDRSVLWNMTPYEAVTQDSQFAEPVKGEISAEAVQAVWAVFDENMRAFDSNATHFYAENSQEPYWTEGKEYVGSRGGNRFYNAKY